MQVVYAEDEYWALNNRRLYCFRSAIFESGVGVVVLDGIPKQFHDDRRTITNGETVGIIRRCKCRSCCGLGHGPNVRMIGRRAVSFRPKARWRDLRAESEEDQAYPESEEDNDPRPLLNLSCAVSSPAIVATAFATRPQSIGPLPAQSDSDEEEQWFASKGQENDSDAGEERLNAASPAKLIHRVKLQGISGMVEEGRTTGEAHKARAVESEEENSDRGIGWAESEEEA